MRLLRSSIFFVPTALTFMETSNGSWNLTVAAIWNTTDTCKVINESVYTIYIFLPSSSAYYISLLDVNVPRNMEQDPDLPLLEIIWLDSSFFFVLIILRKMFAFRKSTSKKIIHNKRIFFFLWSLPVDHNI